MVAALVAIVATAAVAAGGVLLLALPPASARAAHPQAASGAAAAVPVFSGNDLPFMTVAQTDVQVVPGARATLPYRIEGARGGAQVTITISPAAGGKVVKTITIAQPVASDRDSRVSFVCHLKAGRYVWTVHAIDGLLRVPTIVRSAHLTIVSVSPSAAAIAKAIAWLKHRSGVTAVAVIDSNGVLHGWNQDRRFVTASRYFALELLTVRSTATFQSAPDRVQVLSILEGEGRLENEAGWLGYRPGETWVIPPSAGLYRMVPGPDTKFLKFYVPDIEKDFTEPLRQRKVPPEKIRQIVFE